MRSAAILAMSVNETTIFYFRLCTEHVVLQYYLGHVGATCVSGWGCLFSHKLRASPPKSSCLRLVSGWSHLSECLVAD